MTNTEKTFQQALAELVAQYSNRHEETHSGYLVELKSGEYVEIELHSDTNDLEEFKESSEDEDEDEEKIIYICSQCLNELDGDVEECCAGYDVASVYGRREAEYYKYGE